MRSKSRGSRWIQWGSLLLFCFAATVASGSFINYSSKEINVKIVYFGPDNAGQSEVLQYIYAKTNPEAKGKMISLATETERTLFFDFLPLNLGEIRGFRTRFHLYTMPGQVFYDASRKLILKGVDGVVFVFDARLDRVGASLDSFRQLTESLASLGYHWTSLPLVVQINHSGPGPFYPDAIPCGFFRMMNISCIASNVDTGVGVFDALKQIAKEVLTELKKGSEDRVSAKQNVAQAPAAAPGESKHQQERDRELAEKPCGAYSLSADEKRCQFSQADMTKAFASSPLASHQEWLKKIVRPEVWISTETTSMDKIAIGESRFAGVPDLPPGFVWPSYNDVPLTLLAQIRLADIASLDDSSLLPKTGWLYFFYEAGEQPWGDPQEKQGSRVFYINGTEKQLARRSPPRNVPEAAKNFTPCRLHFSPGRSLPDPSDEWVKFPFELHYGEETFDHYQWLAEDISNAPLGGSPLHHLLGYPQVIQNDMQQDCELCFHAEQLRAGWKATDPEVLALSQSAGDWVLLFQIDTDDRGPGWMWGDAGTLYFWIKKQDLIQKRFDRTCTILQCT